MKKVSPSIIGTTLATALAALYTFGSDEKALHLWTRLVRIILLGGPVVVLLTYSITSFILETYVQVDDKENVLGRFEYPLRVVAQVFLGLALAALSEDIRYYIILFTIFVVVSTVCSLSVFKNMPGLLFHDIFNLVCCLLYAFVALHIYDVAHDFERTYPAFALDQTSFEYRVNELRGQQADYFGIMCVAVGAIAVNLVNLLRKWRERLKTAHASPGHA